MISVTWMTDVDRNTEYLECRNENLGNWPGPKTDVVKVYFVGRSDADMIKGRSLEMAIAKQIFSNREKYGNVLTGYLEMFPHEILFKTGTAMPLNRE